MGQTQGGDKPLFCPYMTTTSPGKERRDPRPLLFRDRVPAPGNKGRTTSGAPPGHGREGGRGLTSVLGPPPGASANLPASPAPGRSGSGRLKPIPNLCRTRKTRVPGGEETGPPPSLHCHAPWGGRATGVESSVTAGHMADPSPGPPALSPPHSGLSAGRVKATTPRAMACESTRTVRTRKPRSAPLIPASRTTFLENSSLRVNSLSSEETPA